MTENDKQILITLIRSKGAFCEYEHIQRIPCAQCPVCKYCHDAKDDTNESVLQEALKLMPEDTLLEMLL